MNLKIILIKALNLQKHLKYYSDGNSQVVFEKFAVVWGGELANHFLSKYSDAESLINALDSDNLELFIEKY